MLDIASEHCKPSWGQEDVVPHEPLEEAIMCLWYNDTVPKSDIKVIYV